MSVIYPVFLLRHEAAVPAKSTLHPSGTSDEMPVLSSPGYHCPLPPMCWKMLKSCWATAAVLLAAMATARSFMAAA